MAFSKTANILKWVYKVLRSIVFSAVIAVAILFTLIYASLSIPAVQDYIKNEVKKELGDFLGSDIEIESLYIIPINEVIIKGAIIKDLDGKECLRIERLGGGINIWRLIVSRKIEITYVELLDFTADIYQKSEHTPLNIDFIIKAFSSENKERTPIRFDLKIYNIVIRGGNVKFDRQWKELNEDRSFDASHIDIENLCADIMLPRLSQENSDIDLRRLSFTEKSGLQVKEISGYFKIFPEKAEFRELKLRLPETLLQTSDFTVPLNFFKEKNENKEVDDSIHINIINSRITPSNLACFLPALSSVDISYPFASSVTIYKERIILEDFQFGNNSGLEISARGKITNYNRLDHFQVQLDNLKLLANSSMLTDFLNTFPEKGKSSFIRETLSTVGNITLNASGQYDASTNIIKLNSDLETTAGNFQLHCDAMVGKEYVDGTLALEIPYFDFSGIFPQIKLEEVKGLTVGADGEVNLKKLNLSSGKINLGIETINILGRKISNINGIGEKIGDVCSLTLEANDINLDGLLNAYVTIDGENSIWNIEADINDFDTYSSFLTDTGEEGYEFKGKIKAMAQGNSVDNINGNLDLTEFRVTKWNGEELNIERLALIVNNEADANGIILTSDLVDFRLRGRYITSKIPALLKKTLHEINPLVFSPYKKEEECGEGSFDLTVKDAQPLIDFFKIPIFPLTEMIVEGRFDSSTDLFELSTDIPYIQQGDNKLITGTYLKARVIGAEGMAEVNFGTVYPTKKGPLKMDLDINGKNGLYEVLIDFNKGRNVSFYGHVNINVALEKDPQTDLLVLNAIWIPSSLYLNEAEWLVEESVINYTDGFLKIEGFCIRHDGQYVMINGFNDKAGEGTIKIMLSEIDMDYVFGTLNINHVTFGGITTGSVIARNIFTPNPELYTENLYARDFSYNGTLLGVADLWGRLDLPQRKIGIGAVIREEDKIVAKADGGVWFGRDSLAFNFKADGVNVGFMQPFMSAFSSEVKGKASGEAILYGTFSDIDMTGKIVGEDIDILIDYINAHYTGSDTVYLRPGIIEIPHFTVKDKFGHSANVSGELIHRCFHEPIFNFKVSDMDQLLVYDTNSKINPLWYGTVYVSGNGEISGRPGLVRIAADVETAPGSDFTFVLSDQQEAVKSHFLTFSDKKRIAAEAALAKDTVPDFLKKFRNNLNNESTGLSDIFVMDFRVSVTDDVRFNLIMDPVAGDKIEAYGSGAMTLTYSSRSDELRLYGKYVLDKGTYNFSLQDIILKEFIIKPGSSIAFTGDPYTGILNITAAYRVNTSLTELDQSFASDRELNRTSVPVEALLKVSGVLTNPTIDFDIELPTVTEETAQKVRSIISTEDMMSKQVLYLVALNKFYPPEYMSTSNSGGEWASIASSTISSQIQNMIGQITDKFTLSPTIRSDKGDFSDIEVDLALSSQLFNNRLLINGNVGYRDPSNSSTTFVGDFDIEYLLNKKGTWRLKAYNHFNDQNYYLKSALTTQGLGIVWRKDFGIPRKGEEVETVTEKLNEEE